MGNSRKQITLDKKGETTNSKKYTYINKNYNFKKKLKEKAMLIKVKKNLKILQEI